MESTHAGLLEVVEHPFLENEPPLVLGLVLPSLLGQPATSLRVEESLGQTPLSLRHLELLLFHTLKRFLGTAQNLR